MTTTLIDPMLDQRWPELLRGRQCELFGDRRWLRVLRTTYGFDFSADVVADDDRIHSALATVCIDDLRGRRIVSLPFCDFVDLPCADADWAEISARVADSGLPVRLETPADHPAVADARFDSAIDGVHHCLPVADVDEADLFSGYSTLTRRQVRRAARTGITYRMSQATRDLEDFFALHVGVRKHRHELLAQPPAMFDAIAEQFFGDGISGVIVGERDGAMVGGCLLLATEHAVHYKFSASRADARSDGVSHGAVHAAALWARDRGLEMLDLGRSDLAHTGLVEFKRRFGPVERELAVHRRAWTTNPSADALLGELTAMFVRPDVDDRQTIDAGALLYRFFA